MCILILQLNRITAEECKLVNTMFQYIILQLDGPGPLNRLRLFQREVVL